LSVIVEIKGQYAVFVTHCRRYYQRRIVPGILTIRCQILAIVTKRLISVINLLIFYIPLRFDPTATFAGVQTFSSVYTTGND